MNSIVQKLVEDYDRRHGSEAGAFRQPKPKLPTVQQAVPTPQSQTQTLQHNGKTYSKVTKGGTARTGANRDRGAVVHAVEGLDPHSGFWGTPALCGSEPGRKRGYGWADISTQVDEVEITCKRCRKKLGLPPL